MKLLICYIAHLKLTLMLTILELKLNNTSKKLENIKKIKMWSIDELFSKSTPSYSDKNCVIN